MTTIELKVDDLLLERAQKIAEQYGYSLEEVLARGVEQLEASAREREPVGKPYMDVPPGAEQAAAIRAWAARPRPPAPPLSLVDIGRDSIYD